MKSTEKMSAQSENISSSKGGCGCKGSGSETAEKGAKSGSAKSSSSAK